MRKGAKVFSARAIYAIILCMFFFKAFGQQSDSLNMASDTANAILQTNAPPLNPSVTDSARDSAVEHPSEKLIPRLKQNIERYPYYYLYILFGCLVLLAVVRVVSPSYLKELLLSVVNLRLMLSIFNEGRFDWNFNNFLLDVITVLALSIGIHQGFFATQEYFFVWILAFTGLAYFAKLILIQLLAHIFFGRGEALVHLLMYTLFIRISGLLFLIILFVGLYQTVFPLQQLLLYTALIFGSCYLLWLVRVYVKIKSVSTGNMFYLFLYLCTIEVSPVIILLKEVIV